MIFSRRVSAFIFGLCLTVKVLSQTSSYHVVFDSYTFSYGLEKYYEQIYEAKFLKDRVQKSHIYKKAVLSKYLQQDHCQMILINEFLKSRPDSNCIVFLSEHIEHAYPNLTSVFKTEYWNDNYPEYTKYIKTDEPIGEYYTKRSNLYFSLGKLSAEIREQHSGIDTNLYDQFRLSYQSGMHIVDSFISQEILKDIRKNGYPQARKEGYPMFNAFYYCCLHQSFKDTIDKVEFWVLQKNAVEKGFISNNQYAYLIDHTMVNESSKEKSRYFVILSGHICAIRDVSITDFEKAEYMRKELCLPTLCDELKFYKSGYYLNLAKHCK